MEFGTMIYLDNSATTRPCPAAVAAMEHMLTSCWGNPSSVHHLGVEAERGLKTARQQVAALLGAEPERVFFTSGGTEADNWAVSAAARRLGKRGRHVITTAIEHSAVLNPVRRLEEQGFQVTILQPDRKGRISSEALEAALRPDTILVSVMMVNNEVGTVMPLAEMIRAVRRKSPLALFHTDAVQGLGKVAFKAKTLGADMISVSGHKLHGPKGVGALYIRKGVNLPPLLEGGGQELGLRSGTEALPAIAAFGAACETIHVKEEIDHLSALRDLCREKLAAIPGLVFLGDGTAPHIVSVSVPGLRSQGLINRLQEREIYVSAGSACAKGHRSHVLEAMGIPAAVIDGAIRISFSRDNGPQDLDALYEGLCCAIKSL